MASLKAVIGKTFGLFNTSKVRSVETLGAFRWVELEQPLSHAPGDKVQVLTPDGSMRTWTPFTSGGTTCFLVLLHADSPSPTLARALTPGASLEVFGPRRSLELERLRSASRPVLFGDETSLALASEARRVSASTRVVIEHRVDVTAVLERLRLVPQLVPSTDDAQLIAPLLDGDVLVMSGKAQRIQALRKTGTLPTTQLVKAYWAEGKRGLD